MQKQTLLGEGASRGGTVDRCEWVHSGTREPFDHGVKAAGDPVPAELESSVDDRVDV